MTSVKGTKTEKNLLAAFAGESQARNRYTYFAGVARKEGYEQIAAIFEETAYNEKEHGKLFFKHLEGGDAEITAAYPAGEIADTLKNLEAAAEGEKKEWTTIYEDFAGVADEEGFKDIANTFRQVSRVEKEHEARYRALISNMKEDKVFKKDSGIRWHCRNCGYVHEADKAPLKCPVCKHPISFFEELAENY